MKKKIKLNCVLEEGWNLKVFIKGNISNLVSDKPHPVGDLFWDIFGDTRLTFQLRTLILESIRDFNFIHDDDSCKISSIKNDPYLRAMVAYSVRLWTDINQIEDYIDLQRYESKIPTSMLEEIKMIVKDNFFKSYFPNLHHFYESTISVGDFKHNNSTLLPSICKLKMQRDPSFVGSLKAVNMIPGIFGGLIVVNDVGFQNALLVQRIRMAFEELQYLCHNPFLRYNLPINGTFIKNVDRNLALYDENISRFNSVVFPPNGITIDGFNLADSDYIYTTSSDILEVIYPKIRSVLEKYNTDNHIFNDDWVIDTVTRLIIIRFMTNNITQEGVLVLDKNETIEALDYHPKFKFDDPEHSNDKIKVRKIVNDDGSIK